MRRAVQKETRPGCAKCDRFEAEGIEQRCSHCPTHSGKKKRNSSCGKRGAEWEILLLVVFTCQTSRVAPLHRCQQKDVGKIFWEKFLDSFFWSVKLFAPYCSPYHNAAFMHGLGSATRERGKERQDEIREEYHNPESGSEGEKGGIYTAIRGWGDDGGWQGCLYGVAWCCGQAVGQKLQG